MRIGIVGGTGGMGRGFAMRWCPKHDIMIGSRDAGRAQDSAREYLDAAKAAMGPIGGMITGHDNDTVARESDVLILSIKYENIESTCSRLLPLVRDDCVVVSPIVPMTKTGNGFEFIPMMEGRPFAHQLVQGYMKDGGRLVSAFHVISEKKLADPALSLDYDIFVCGDDDGAMDVVDGMIGEIRGLRSIRLGGSMLAYMAEIATPLLLNVMLRNGIRNPGIKIV